MQITQHETHFEGYFALDWLYSFIRWLEGFISILEELISVLSGPLLAIGLSFSLVDFLMQGSLLKSPSIALAWSIVQAAAVDAQLVLMWHKSKMAIRARNGWSFVGFVILGLALAFVAFGAVALQCLQQSAGMDSAKALQSLGLTAEELVYARSAVAIILACVAGWTRSPIGHMQMTFKTVPAPQKKENAQPGFFARRWAAVRYWFELRKAVKQAQKLRKNQEVVLEKFEGNQDIPEPQKEPEVLPEIVTSNQENEQAIIDTCPVIDVALQPELSTENFGSFDVVDAPVGPFNDDWSYTEFLPILADSEESQEEENKQENQAEETIEQEVSVSKNEEPEIEESQTQLKSIRQQIKYAPAEAVKLPICQQHNISQREIKKAIADGKLRANQEGKVSKNALENWVKSLKLVA